MLRMIACCGLICTDCPTYIATIKDDNKAREKTAVYLKRALKIEPKAVFPEKGTVWYREYVSSNIERP